MRGAYFSEVHKVEIRDDLPKPSIKPDEVLIKVKFCGICGTDVESYITGILESKKIILGHEFSGEIVEVGANVKKWKIADRVTANPNTPCWDCYECDRYNENMCRLAGTGLGLTRNGAQAEYIDVKEERLHLLPDSVSFEEGAMIEPLAIAVYAVQESGIKIGENATVLGAGTIGLFVIQVLRAAGVSKIFVVEPVESKQKKALEVGADEVMDPKKWSKINKLTDKIGPDHIFDCVGNPDSIMTSLQLVKRGGKITLIGIHAKPFETKGFMQLVLKNITLKGDFSYNQDSWKTAIELIEQKKINLAPIITKRIKLEEVPEMYEVLANPPHEEIKVLIEIS